MDKHGEYLFEVTSKNLLKSVKAITEEDIVDCCEYKIFDRGLNYYKERQVENVNYNITDNSINGRVKGSHKYEVEIFIEQDEVHGSCTCPYHDVCKHIIAILLKLVNEGVDNTTSDSFKYQDNIQSVDFVKKYLKSYSKDKLVELILKYAPESFITQVLNTRSDGDEAKKIFDQVADKVNNFFKDTELLWDPSGMDGAIIYQLNRLRGLENKLTRQIGELIINIINKVENAFNEGYLYIDNYYEEDYFESQDFCEFVINYVKQLSFKAKIVFIESLDEELNMMSYSTFELLAESYDRFFSEDEINTLRAYILDKKNEVTDSVVARMYDFMEQKFTISEKEYLLKRLIKTNHKYIIILSRLFVSQERFSEAHKMLDEFITQREGLINCEIMEHYLDVSYKLGNDMGIAATRALEHCPKASMLFKIQSLIRNKLTEYEDILKEKRPEELLHFYEKEKRLEDALLLIKETKSFYDNTLFEFFKKHKRQVLKEAEEYFIQRISINLKDAGESYYSRVAETVGQLKQINSSMGKKILEEIRINYKRRPKLIGMLQRY